MESSTLSSKKQSSAFSGVSLHGVRRSMQPTKGGTNFLKSSQSSSSSPTTSSSGVGKSDAPTKGCTEISHYSRDYGPGLSLKVEETANDGQHKKLSKIHWRRKVGAVKSKLGDNGEQCERNTVKKIPRKIMMKDNNGDRRKVVEMLELFRKRCDEISRNEKDKTRRVDLKAMSELRREGKIWRRCSSVIGQVAGVEIGDKFRYRVELVIAGLHKHYERGIDYTVTHGIGGRHIATCVIAMEEHCDKMSDPNVLIYVGEGGKGGPKEGCDQQLKGGNLALYESMRQRSVVRVVKGCRKEVYDGGQRRFVPGSEYIYDGLYEVVSCEKKVGFLRKLVFEFKLSRCSGQPALSWKTCSRIRF